MTLLVLWVRQALHGMRRGLLIQLAATGAIAVGLLLVGLALLGAANVDRLTEHWGRGVQLVVYLKPDAPEQRVAALARLLRGRAEVLAVRAVSSSEAFRRLEESLGGRRSLLAGVERDFLPASLEIGLRENDERTLRPLLGLLNAAPVVEEVEHLGGWVKRLSAIAHVLRLIGLALALVVGCACLYIVGSTIRLGVFARREEIEILKLVGATDRYVRAPYLIEGALQGLLGALFAALLLGVLFRLAAPRLEGLLTTALTHLRLEFLPTPQLALGLIGGALLGLIGSRLALGRYLDV